MEGGPDVGQCCLSPSKNRSGHHQGQFYSDVYRDGKAYVYSAWNDNEDEVGVEMSFDKWKKPYTSDAGSTTTTTTKKKKKKTRKRK